MYGFFLPIRAFACLFDGNGHSPITVPALTLFAIGFFVFLNVLTEGLRRSRIRNRLIVWKVVFLWLGFFALMIYPETGGMEWCLLDSVCLGYVTAGTFLVHFLFAQHKANLLKGV
jgi:hypothetical protein